jgi:hypothetical protein
MMMMRRNNKNKIKSIEQTLMVFRKYTHSLIAADENAGK